MKNLKPIEPRRHEGHQELRKPLIEKPGSNKIFCFGFLCALCAFVVPFRISVAFAEEPAAKPAFPTVVLCGTKHNTVFHVLRNHTDWDYALDGPLKDIQPQPLPGYYLVTGGSRQVLLLRKVWKGCRVVWHWGQLPGVAVESAVVADWDEKDNPTLVLAADSLNQRIFLADAKTRNPKIRWEYQLAATPRRVHLCTDSGNFLVVLQDSTVEEVFFQEDKVVWQLGKADGLADIRDAVRDPWANTYVADAATGDVLCYGPQKQLDWKTHLPFAPGPSQDMSLALFRENHKRMVMAAVHFSGTGPESQNVIYVLNAETGKVTDWNDHDDKGGYPDFTKAVPDEAEYYKKQ